MKKFIILLTSLLFSVQLFSQEHIKFNGATFGQSLPSFVQSLRNSSKSHYQFIEPKGYNSNICNRASYYVKLNSQDWQYQVFSSRISNTVFRTISVNSFYSDLETQLML